MDHRTRRDLTLLLGGATVSTMGSSVTVVTVLLHVRPLGPGWVAMVLGASLLPIVVLSPVAGQLVDRLPNRQLLAATLGIQAVAIGCVAWLGLGEGAAGMLVAGLAVAGAAAAVAYPTVSALLPVISGEQEATRAYGYSASLNQGGLLAGAAIAGVLVETVGTRGALIVDAASFTVMALAVLALRAQRRVIRRDPPGGDRRSPGPGSWTGFVLLARDPLLRVVVPGLALTILASVVVNIAEVFFLVEDLGLSPIGYGLITACWPLAGVLGGALAGRLVDDRGLVAGLAVGGVAMGAAVALAGWVATVPGAAVCWAIAGAANAVQLVCIQSLVRSRVDDAHRGRAFAAMSAVLQSANVAGLVVSAPVVAVLGTRTSMIVTGMVTVMVVVVVHHLARRVVHVAPLHDLGLVTRLPS